MDASKVPLVKPGMAQACNLPEDILEVLQKRRRDKVRMLGEILVDQCNQLQQIHYIQMQLTDEDPLLLPPISPQPKPNQAMQSSPMKLENAIPKNILAVSAESTSLGKVARLTAEQESSLLSFFALQDTLSREAASHFAEEVGCTEQQVKEYFNRLRKSVRDFLHKLQKKSHVVPTQSQSRGNPSVSGANTVVIDLEGDERFNETASQDPMRSQQAKSDTSRQSALETLDQNLQDGVIRSNEAADAVANLMRHSRNWSVRQSCLQAIRHTKNTAILQKMLHSVNLLAMLSSWIDEAKSERQISCLRAILKALAKFKLTEKNLTYNDLPQKLSSLQILGIPHLGKTVKSLLQQWGLLESPKKKTVTSTVDPVAIAVALNKRDSSNQVQPQFTSPPESKKRSLEAGPKAPQQTQKVPKLVKPSNQNLVHKSSRLDVTALGNIKNSRQPAFKPKANSQQEQALADYKSRQRALQDRIKHHQNLESQQAAKNVARAKAWKTSETPKFHLFWSVNSNNFGIQRGSESAERSNLETRHRSRAEARYLHPGEIPFSPHEPLFEPPIESRPTKIPFVPTDPSELKQQYKRLKQSGVLLEHLVPASFFLPNNEQTNGGLQGRASHNLAVPQHQHQRPRI